MAVDVQLAADGDSTPDAALIARWAAAALGGDPRELCVRVVGLEEGRSLNATYRRIDKATNVLSFSADDLPPGVPILGDVVICAPVVECEAKQQHKSVEHHYAHMVVHGILHLRGYDHETDGEAQAMEREEIMLLDGFGIADPYVSR